MIKAPINMTPGDDTHLTLLMAPVSLNFVTGQDREHLLAYGRAAFEAGQKCQDCAVQQGTHVPMGTVVKQIQEPQKFTGDSEMRRAFEIEYGQDWTDPDWRKEVGAWASAWHKATAAARELAAVQQGVQPAVPSLAELEAAAELGALRDVYEMARGVLRYDGVDTQRAIRYRDGLIEAIETVKTIDGGTWEPAHPAEGVPAQAAPAIFGDEDHVLVPRGLIGAACSAIDKKRDGTKTLAELRRYTTGDLSAATHPTQQGLDSQRWQIVHNRISGEYIAGRAHFVVQLPPVPDTNIMRGSVAEHFTKAVDFAVAQAKKGDV